MLDDTEDGVVMRFPGTRSLAPDACRRWLALFVSLLAALVAALAAVGGGASAAARGDALGQQLRRARTFALALGVDLRAPVAVAKLSRYELVVVDGVDAPRAAIRRLRQRGAVVLGYLSVGSIERGRFWTKRALPYALGKVPGWPERYADVSRPGYRRLLVNTVAPRERARALSTLKALRQAGLVVTTTDYPPPGNRRAALAAVYAACSAGALPWISDIDLAALPPEPWRCPTAANARPSAARK